MQEVCTRKGGFHLDRSKTIGNNINIIDTLGHTVLPFPLFGERLGLDSAHLYFVPKVCCKLHDSLRNSSPSLDLTGGSSSFLNQAYHKTEIQGLAAGLLLYEVPVRKATPRMCHLRQTQVPHPISWSPPCSKTETDRRVPCSPGLTIPGPPAILGGERVVACWWVNRHNYL